MEASVRRYYEANKMKRIPADLLNACLGQIVADYGLPDKPSAKRLAATLMQAFELGAAYAKTEAGGDLDLFLDLPTGATNASEVWNDVKMRAALYDAARPKDAPRELDRLARDCGCDPKKATKKKVTKKKAGS